MEKPKQKAAEGKNNLQGARKIRKAVEPDEESE